MDASWHRIHSDHVQRRRHVLLLAHHQDLEISSSVLARDAVEEGGWCQAPATSAEVESGNVPVSLGKNVVHRTLRTVLLDDRGPELGDARKGETSGRAARVSRDAAGGTNQFLTLVVLHGLQQTLVLRLRPWSAAREVS